MLSAGDKKISYMISVIIPYYNPNRDSESERLLHRAILSVRDNLDGLIPYEVILVNDGSPGDPDMRPFGGMPLYYTKRAHGMLGAARNTGIDNAKGDMLAFLDADDYYFPGTLVPCIKAMEQNGADLVGFGFRTTRTSAPADCPVSGKPAFSALCTGNEYMSQGNLFSGAWQFIISTRLIRGHGLRFMENRYIEDEEFTPRLLFFSKRMTYTRHPVYAYYVHPGTIITSHSAQNTELKSSHTIAAIQSLLEFRQEHSTEQHDGLDKKIDSLAIDQLRRTLRRKDWHDALPVQIRALQRMGLFPLRADSLPARSRLFAALSGNRTGQYLLHLIELFYK